MRLSILLALVVFSVQAIAGNADAYFKPRFKQGETFTDLYSKSIAVTGDGFDPIVRRFSGSSVYVVTDPSSIAPQFDETDTIDGRPPTAGRLEIRDSGNTNCYNASCYLNNQTSGLMFIPLLWGTPPDNIRAGQTWTVNVDKAWEIGPAGTEIVRVVSLDSRNHIAILQRDGHGAGPSDEDKRGLMITVNGKTAHADVEAASSHWTGQIIIRAGIVLSDEILIERRITLKSELGTFVGQEREYTIVTAGPSRR